MATTAMLKRRKIAAANKKQVSKTKGGARRKRSVEEEVQTTAPAHAPYEWGGKEVEAEEVVQINKITPKRLGSNDIQTDTSEDTESDVDKEEDDEEMEVSKTNQRSSTTPPSAAKNRRIDHNDDALESLQQHIDKLQNRNMMLSRQIRDVTKMGGVDRYEVMQLRKMVKEDLFKRVKFITTMTTEKNCLQYLSNKLNILQETKRDWCATYAHCVRDALNNKRNNVSQDLKTEIKGKTMHNKRNRHIQLQLTTLDPPFSMIAILAEPETKNITAEAFLNIRDAKSIIQQVYFNLFFW